VKVLLASPIPPPHVVGGAEVLARGLAHGLRAAGHTVELITLAPTDGSRPGAVGVPTPVGAGVRGGAGHTPGSGPSTTEVPVHLLRPGNLYSPLDGARRDRSALPTAAWHLRDQYNSTVARQLRQLFAEHQPDVVHTHNVDGFSPLIWREARRGGAAVVHTLHDYHLACVRATLVRSDRSQCTSPPLPCRAFAALSARRVANWVDAVVAPSQYVLRRHQEAGLTFDTARVIRNAVPPAPGLDSDRHVGGSGAGEPDHHAPDDLHAPDDGRFTVVFLGQLVAHKGVLELLDAWTGSEVLQRQGRLVVAGTGELGARVAAAAGAHPSIRVAGFVDGDAKARLLRRADLVAVPSVWPENAPMVVVEAHAAGTPCLVSSLGGLPEMVRPDIDGVVLDTVTPERLRAELERLAGDPGRLAELARHCRPEAGPDAFQHMVEAHHSLYRELRA
jgi:glycosyltransferase involved in cell wall biosynthesis